MISKTDNLRNLHTGPNWVRISCKELESFYFGHPLGNANSFLHTIENDKISILSACFFYCFSLILGQIDHFPQIAYKANLDKLGQRKTNIGSELGPTVFALFGPFLQSELDSLKAYLISHFDTSTHKLSHLIKILSTTKFMPHEGVRAAFSTFLEGQ